MNDRALSLLEQYDFTVPEIRKGRGAVLFETDRGCCIFQEYNGNPKKLPLQNEVLKEMYTRFGLMTEQLIPNKEGAYFVEDTDGKKYIVKTFFEDGECNIRDIAECREAAKTLGRLHNALSSPDFEEVRAKLPVCSLDAELEKHNRELKKIRLYLGKRGQKSPFEILLLEKYPYFFEQAVRILESMQQFFLAAEYKKEKNIICHGDFRHHNIIRCKEGFALIHFEKMAADSPMRDLGLFLRKCLEKNAWNVSLGDAVLCAYGEERALSKEALLELYYRLAYPEKFWKIVNFYYNSRKVWIPEKNSEKLHILWEQEKEKQLFLEQIFQKTM